MRIAEAVRWGAGRLAEAGVEAPRRTAGWLLEHTARLSAAEIVAYPERLLDDTDRAAFADAIGRRAAGVPLQHILGDQEFCGLAFEVTPDVLIPRPETEILVDAAIRRWREAGRDGDWILDVGTGSGCIPVVLARACPCARVAAVDVSAPALAVARRNAARHGAAVRFVNADLASAFGGPVAILTANLPYIPDGDIPSLQREVRDHDPHLALAGGPDGLDLYRRLLADAPRVIAPHGVVLCEIGAGQDDEFAHVVAENDLRLTARLEDHAGIPRVMVVGRR